MYELLGEQIQARKCYFQKVPKAMGKRVMESMCLLTCVYSRATPIKTAYMERCWHADSKTHQLRLQEF